MKLLIGGSPCTHWSIAQTKNRETEPEGLGWELFKNYLIALEKFKPDFFLYENNKSMSAAIREQITKELGVEPILINSALVSAQNRQRLYWTNIPGVEQPEDMGILLRDILERGIPLQEKAYTLKAQYYKNGMANFITNGGFAATAVAEPINITADGKAQCLRATYYKDGIRNMVGNTVDRKTCVAEPVRIGTIESDAKNAEFDSQQYRVYSPDGKSVTLCGKGGGVGAKTGLYAAPVRVGDMPNASGEVSGSQSGRIYSVDGKGVPLQARPNGGGADGEATGLYAIPQTMEPVRVCNINGGGQGNRIYRTDAKSCAVKAQGGGLGGHGQGLYAIPADCDLIITDNSIRCQRRDKKHSTVQGSHVNFEDGKSQTLSVAHTPRIIEPSTGKEWPVYEVRDGQITIKGKQYPIKLADGGRDRPHSPLCAGDYQGTAGSAVHV